MPALSAYGRHDLPDCQWLVLESVLAAVLPRGKKAGRPRKWPLRLLIDGIRWRTRTGSPWRDVPEEYGPWPSVYGLFRRWQRNGTWAALVTALQALADTKPPSTSPPSANGSGPSLLKHALVVDVPGRKHGQVTGSERKPGQCSQTLFAYWQARPGWQYPSAVAVTAACPEAEPPTSRNGYAARSASEGDDMRFRGVAA